jgi:hypothetical protein
MWDSIQNVPYAFKGNQWISFDDIQSTTAKVSNLYFYLKKHLSNFCNCKGQFYIK